MLDTLPCIFLDLSSTFHLVITCNLLCLVSPGSARLQRALLFRRPLPPIAAPLIAMDYLQWYDKWGSWDPYTAIMSKIDDDLEEVLMIIRLLFGENCRLKKIKFRHLRVDWEYHVYMLEYTNEFEQRFWMYLSMFDDLVEELRVPLTVSFTQFLRSTSTNEPIYPEMIVAIGLRILGLSDTMESCADNYGLSVASVKRVFDLFLNAIDYNEMCRAMRIELPWGEDALRDLAQRWFGILTCPQGLYWGHIGTADG
jgi:hypothetical protein